MIPPSIFRHFQSFILGGIIFLNSCLIIFQNGVSDGAMKTAFF